MAIEPIDPNDDERRSSRRRDVARRRRDHEVAEPLPHELALALPPEERDEDDDELSLREIWGVLRKHRWLVLGCAAFVTIVALVASLLETPLYRSTATVQIVNAPLKVVQLQGVEAVGAGSRADFMGTQLELLKSRSVAQRAVRQLGLVGDPRFEKTVTQDGAFAQLMGFVRGSAADDKPESLADRENDVVDAVMDNSEIHQVRGADIVEINYVSPDPAVAQRVANGLAQAYRAADLARREENSAYARNFLQDQLQQLKLKLENSERAVIDYAQQQKLASVDENKSLVQSTLESLNAALSQAVANRAAAEAHLTQMEAGGPLAVTTNGNVMTVLSQLRDQQAQLQAQYMSMRSTFKPDYPKMLELKHQIDELQVRINAEMGNYVRAARADVEAAKANEDLLRKQIADLQTQLLDLQGRSVQYNILKREADTNRQLYDALLQRFKEIGVAGSADTGSVAMVDAAMPGIRFKPNIPRSLLIGMLLGLLSGIGLAFVVERLDDTLKSPEDIERLLRLPVVGVVPKVDGDLVDTIAEDQRSSFAEAYRSLRTGLQYSSDSGSPRTLLVTSTLEGEGKSTTALMLARKFAQLGMRVLLIDADLRKPSLHKRLGLDNELGLSGYLSGQLDGAMVFKSGGVDNLTVVTSGQAPPNPAELLSAPRFRSLLTVAGHSYDQIILDAPPLLGLADVPIISTTVDGTLLVIEAGRGRVGAIRAGLKRLFAVRARLVGTVLVKYDPKTASYGYGSGYADYYYYQYAEASGAERGKRRRLLKG